MILIDKFLPDFILFGDNIPPQVFETNETDREREMSAKIHDVKLQQWNTHVETWGLCATG